MKHEPDELTKGGHLSEVAHYLAQHLISILVHASGGRHPSRAWIYRNTDGDLVHTFDERIQADSDSWGGDAIPIGCLSNDKKSVFAPRVAELRGYIRTFGLTENHADAVLAAIPQE